MQRVYAAANLQEAHLVRQLLEQSGIAARVFNENAQGGMGEIPFTHVYPELWVEDERDAARAAEIIQEFEHAPEVQGETACPRCGEVNPANFELCWRCGRPLERG